MAVDEPTSQATEAEMHAAIDAVLAWPNPGHTLSPPQPETWTPVRFTVADPTIRGAFLTWMRER